MAHFTGYLKGAGQEVSRTGTVETGVTASVEGYSIGGRVTVRHREAYREEFGLGDAVALDLWDHRSDAGRIAVCDATFHRGELVVTVIHKEFLRRVSDKGWQLVMRDEELARKLRLIAFCNPPADPRPDDEQIREHALALINALSPGLPLNAEARAAAKQLRILLG